MRRLLWFAFGVVLVAAGVTLAVTAGPTGPTDFGWFAYSPLEGGVAGLAYL